MTREGALRLREPDHRDGRDRAAVPRSVSGTVFADGRPRIVNIKGIRMDAEFGPSMIYITNLDKPGFIGTFSGTLGEAGINIATFHVGREAPGGNAIALIEIDGELPADVLAKVQALPQVQSARPLKFDPRPLIVAAFQPERWPNRTAAMLREFHRKPESRRSLPG